MKSLAWLVLLAVVSGVQAGEEESTPCDNVDTDQQTYACAAFNKQTAERELKSAYDDLISAFAINMPTKATRPLR